MTPRIEITTYLDRRGRAVIHTVITDDRRHHLAPAPEPPTSLAAPMLELAPALEAQSA